MLASRKKSKRFSNMNKAKGIGSGYGKHESDS